MITQVLVLNGPNLGRLGTVAGFGLVSYQLALQPIAELAAESAEPAPENSAAP